MRALNSIEVADGATHYDPTGVAFLSNITTPESSDTNTSSSQVTSMSTEALFFKGIAKGMDFWVPPFLFVIGNVTNVLVIMVMWSKHFSHISTSFYMSVSAIVDSISLIIPLPVHYLYVNFPEIFDSIRHVNVICSICHPIGWISSNLGVVLTVAMTVDRSLAIQFPLKAPTLCTVKRAKIVTFCLFVLEILLEGHMAFTSRVVPKEVKAFLCAIDKHVSESYRVFHDDYWPNMHNALLLISFLIIIVGNIIIILHVKRSEDSKDIGEGAKSTGGSQSGKMSSKSRQLSVMLVIDSASIMICTLPLSIYMVVDQHFQSSKTFEDIPLEQARRDVIFASVFYLLYLNHCTNFFLYCVSGARFRKALKDVLRLTPRQKNADSSKSSGSSGK